MLISTYEAWLEEGRVDDERLPKTCAQHVYCLKDPNEELGPKRAALLARFPYSVAAQGHYPEHDYACRWCWQNFGPWDGVCQEQHSQYPACPRVMATEHIARGVWKDRDGNEKPWEEKRYLNPGAHTHEGRWTYLWLGKTDYDYGYGEFFFAEEADHDRFLAAFPSFTWSEDWDKEDS